MKSLILPALLLSATPAAAQVTTVTEPLPDYSFTPVMLPIERDQNGVVKAQYIKPGDVSPEDYARLLEEADRVAGYTNYVAPASTYSTTSAPTVSAPIASTPAPTITYTAQPSSTASRAHTVVKGDTLYNIAKRNGVTVEQIRSANGLSGNAIGLGQSLVIPSNATRIIHQVPELSALNTQDPIITGAVLQANQTSTRTTMGTTIQNVAPAPQQPATQAASQQVQPLAFTPYKPYAVLPGDTLYGISKRACVSVDALRSTNALRDNAIAPGQKLTLPAGHCLN